MRLPPALKKEFRKRPLLKTLTTFRIGGPVDLLATPRGIAQLRDCVRYFRARDIPVRVIGAGSNILSSDQGIRGALIKLNQTAFRSIRLRGARVHVGAGVSVAALLRYCGVKGLGGLEFLAGIPGTVGGALAMNCGVSTGASRRSIGDVVERVRVMKNDGTVVEVAASQITFAYRHSSLSRWIITSAVFTLRRARPRTVRLAIKEWYARRSGQEYAFPSAGCVFKNPSIKISAGKLIDACGLKGSAIGGARVSEKHANFIVNTGRATCADVMKLMSRVQKEVKLRHGIRLTSEIKIWK